MWTLGYTWCQFHLVTGVFSTTASIVHLVAISLDRYFAIMFPTEYQRHSVSTSILPYVIMIWLMALAVSSTLFMEQVPTDGMVCWIDNPQYIVLSSFLSFFLPGVIVVYMYVKIFRKLRNHQLYMFGQSSKPVDRDKRRSLPRVIIEEVRSRRGSRLSQTGSGGGSPTRRSSGSNKSGRSPSHPEIHCVPMPPQRWRSPTICAETFEHDRHKAANKRVSIVPDPPSMDISSISNINAIRAEHEAAQQREREINDEEFRKEEEARKTSEDRVRKLSEEAKIRRDQRRRDSTEDRPNGIPIMVAFHKAYNDVRMGRRRSSLCREDSENSNLHMTLRTNLSTVYADDEENSEETTTLNKETYVDTEIALPVPTIQATAMGACPILMDKTIRESSSTEASNKPLLSIPNVSHRPSRVDLTVKSPTINNRLNLRLMLNKIRKLESNANSPLFRCQSMIPPPTFLMAPAVMRISTPPLSPNNSNKGPSTLTVPRMYDCPSPTYGTAPSNSSHSSYTSASGSSDTYRRVSMNSYGSSLTDATDSTFEMDSRRSSAWSTLKTAVFSNDFNRQRNHRLPVEISIEGENSHKKSAGAISKGKLRRIATQVTRAIRRKRRESLAIRRESRATRVVAAILLAFLICWLPYFIISVYRGVCTGLQITLNIRLHTFLYVGTSWLGYAHSCFNPVIYMCLNKNFRVTLRKLFNLPK